MSNDGKGALMERNDPGFAFFCRRAKAAKHFAWEPGMLVFVPGAATSEGLRVVEVRGDNVPHYAMPDMSDERTLDILRAALVKRLRASRTWIHIDLRDGQGLAERLVAMMEFEP